MSNRKISLGLLVVGLLSVFLADAAQAQVPRIRIRQNTYDVTIVSEFGIPVRVGIFGYSERATFRLTFDGGRTGPDVYDQELIAGDRVIIVWDTRGRRLMVADVTIDSSGTLVLGPQFGAAARRGAAVRGGAPAGGRAAAAAPMGGDIPRLKITPKN